MCYSEKQSLQSFVINLIACFLLYNTKSNYNKLLALFFGFIGFMQLFDFILWKNQDVTNKQKATINYITTRIAMVFNHLQPIIFAFLIYIFIGSLGKFSQYIIIIYTLYAIYYTLNAKITYTLSKTFQITNQKLIRTSLKWDWNYQEHTFTFYTVFIIALLILSYENLKFPFNIILSFINLFVYVFSFYYFKNHFVGRFWCKLVAWVPLIFLGFYY